MISSGEADLMILCLKDSSMNKRAIRLKSPRYVLFVRSLVAIKKTKWTGLSSRELNSIPCPEVPRHAIVSVTPVV